MTNTATLTELNALLRIELQAGDRDVLRALWDQARLYSRKQCAEILGHTGPKYTLVGKEIAGIAINTATALACARRADDDGVAVYTGCVQTCFEIANFPEDARSYVVQHILDARKAN